MVLMDNALRRLHGRVKWFDPNKGYGFVLPDDGEQDILLHVNALRNFGQNSVCDDAGIEVTVQETSRGLQVVEIIAIEPPQGLVTDAHEHVFAPENDLATLPLEPARVKWFDRVKGFGFANVFGRPEDVFIHMEVLRRSGFAELQPGEAIGLRIAEGERGRMAVSIASWEGALKKGALVADA